MPTTPDSEVVELSASDGVVFIATNGPLTRLHYFDGQYLRASALTLEQDYHRQAQRLANRAGGHGVVEGFAIRLEGAELRLGAGLAITPNGDLVLGSAEVGAPLTALMGTAQSESQTAREAFGDCLQSAPAQALTEPLQLYVVTVGPVEGLCGNEAVYGKLCDNACATDSRRPYWREGLVLRLRPLTLALPSSTAVTPSLVHLRNRIASAFFAAEPGQPTSLLSAAGLASGVWCAPAQIPSGDEVPVGLLWRDAGVARVDAWSARRERMDSGARDYWHGRMGMRPWNAFLAQVLQFQCQLSGLFEAGQPVILPEDDCLRLRDALGQARSQLDTLLRRYSDSARQALYRMERRPTTAEYKLVTNDLGVAFADLGDLQSKLAELDQGGNALPTQRMLINAGFLQLPPAGYLPLQAGDNAREQLERMFGEGVALTLHGVRSDEIGHLLEQAQHMQRISLTRGLDDPKQLENVEVFLPDGLVLDGQAAALGLWWRTRITLPFDWVGMLGKVPPEQTGGFDAKAVQAVAQEAMHQASSYRSQSHPKAFAGTQGLAAQAPDIEGLTRTEARADGSVGLTTELTISVLNPQTQAMTRVSAALAGDLSRDPFALSVGQTTELRAEGAVGLGAVGAAVRVSGRLTVLASYPRDAGARECQFELDAVATAVTVSETKTVQLRYTLSMVRHGDGRTGLFLLDGPKLDAGNGQLAIEWDGDPLHADVAVKAAIKDQTFELRLIQLDALPAAPASTSTLGAQALEGLTHVAEVNHDPGLLLRMRERLFPLLGPVHHPLARATQDWVMFRRARSCLCAPPAVVLQDQAETFQVWHLRLDDEKMLEVFTQAIDTGDEKMLQGFKPARVGLLHYRDQSAYSEESAAQVLAMWTAAQPDARVAIGRVWEGSPIRGQGWQNHMRLRHMLAQIHALTDVPPSGGSEVHAIEPPPGLLGDSAYDGGMLVVTMGAEVVAHQHLVFLCSHGSFQDVLPSYKRSPDAGWKETLDMAESGDDMQMLKLTVQGKALTSESQQQLAEALKKQQPDMPGVIGYELLHLLVDVASPPQGVDPASDHDAVLNHLQTSSALPATLSPFGNFTVNLAELQAGIGAASVIGVQAQLD